MEIFDQLNYELNFEEKKLIVRDGEEKREYTLTEVTAEQILQFRKNKIPSFVLKIDGKCYHTEIASSLNLMSADFAYHKCVFGGKVCRHLSALSDEEGGCARIRLGSRARIEKIPWIVAGYQTFATKHDMFVIADCLHYQDPLIREIMSPLKTNRLIDSIAAYFFDDEDVPPFD